MKKLLGSTTSPYVRRIRLMLNTTEYVFEEVVVFSEEGQKILQKYTPTGRVPILVDGDNVIWDSLLIANYLSEKPLSLNLQKELVLINEMTDAGIQLFQLRKNATDPEDKGDFSKNNLRRIGKILDYFENKNLNDWNILSQWLFSTLFWFNFRTVYPWQENHPKFVQFYETNLTRKDIQETNPRI